MIEYEGEKIMARIIPIPIGPIYPGGECTGIIHVVQKGDSLYQIGRLYQVSVSQLIFANPFVDIYNLQIGDELCVPAVIPSIPVGAGERSQNPMFNNWRDMDEMDDAYESDDMDEPDEM